MASFSYIGLAVFCVFAISVCGANPVTNARTNKDSLNLSDWLHSVAISAEQVTLNNTPEEADAGLDILNNQDSTSKVAVASLPIFIHKEDTDVDVKITPSSLSDADKVNPFVRSKRSTCTTPGNLPQLVKDLNKRLTADQFVGLNAGEPTTTAAPTNDNRSCPSGPTGDWWPRTEENLRSTCPWKLVSQDLGPNAFPRYVNSAVCLCNKSCIGSDTMRCKEVTYDVTYFNRTGCQDGLAVMERLKYTINIGCHCVGAERKSIVKNENTQ